MIEHDHRMVQVGKFPLLREVDTLFETEKLLLIVVRMFEL
jgi:hypothetical protein